MEIARATDGTYEHGDAGRFTGEVSLRGTLRADDGTNIGIVHFAAGARTHWHSMPVGSSSMRSPGAGGSAVAVRPATCSSRAT